MLDKFKKLDTGIKAIIGMSFCFVLYVGLLFILLLQEVRMEDNVKLNISFLLNELTDEELTQVVELIEGIRIRKIVRSMRT